MVSLMLTDSLLQKGAFLEEWLHALCSSLPDESTCKLVTDSVSEIQKKESTANEKKTMISAAMISLLDIYRSCRHQSLILRFENLVKSLS